MGFVRQTGPAEGRGGFFFTVKGGPPPQSQKLLGAGSNKKGEKKARLTQRELEEVFKSIPREATTISRSRKELQRSLVKKRTAYWGGGKPSPSRRFIANDPHLRRHRKNLGTNRMLLLAGVEGDLCDDRRQEGVASRKKKGGLEGRSREANLCCASRPKGLSGGGKGVAQGIKKLQNQDHPGEFSDQRLWNYSNYT